MIDIKALQSKLDTLVEHGESKGADWALLGGYTDHWDDPINTLKQEILWEIELLNLEAEKK